VPSEAAIADIEAALCDYIRALGTLFCNISAVEDRQKIFPSVFDPDEDVWWQLGSWAYIAFLVWRPTRALKEGQTGQVRERAHWGKSVSPRSTLKVVTSLLAYCRLRLYRRSFGRRCEARWRG
jgi:hypothetical protein